MDSPLIRLAILNDYEVVVTGLAKMLAPYEHRIEIVELVAGKELDSVVDVALYDTFAQTQGGSLDCAGVRRASKAEKLVIYSWQAEREDIAAYVKCGVDGYVSKRVPAATLVDALERIHKGEVLLVTDPDTGEPEGADWPGRGEGLSEREAEVLALIAQGLSNEQVAGRAFLSINTVKSYIRSGYRKIGVSSRSQAVLWAVDHGFRPDRVRIRNPDTDDL